MSRLPETDVARIDRFCEQAVPADMRDQMRVEWTVRGGSVTLWECRPPWRAESTEWSRLPVAQMRYDEHFKGWLLYWADRNSRWHRYDDLDRCSLPRIL